MIKVMKKLVPWTPIISIYVYLIKTVDFILRIKSLTLGFKKITFFVPDPLQVARQMTDAFSTSNVFLQTSGMMVGIRYLRCRGGKF